MSDIFLSYRRQDTLSATGRLADQLEQYFGPQRVFRDYDSIIAGADFADAINSAISVSTVVLAVVGPDWADARDSQGRRRLDDQGDFVRLEIEAAFRAEVPVIPILVGGAKMPPAEALPPSLQAFSRCQAVELMESRWRDDVNRLIGSLQAQFAIETEALPSPAGNSEAMDVFSRFALDMLELATHPRRLIARRQTGRTLDHVRAFLFLFACLLLGNLALVIGVGVSDAISWLLVGVLFGLILITLVSVPLTLAWRLCGARTEFRQVTLIFSYIYGGAWLGFCAGALMIVLGAQLVDAEVFTRYLAIFRLPQPLAERALLAQTLLDSTMQGPAIGMATLAALVWLMSVIWVVGAWGAFRLTYNLGRLRAMGATLIWLALLALVIQMASMASRW